MIDAPSPFQYPALRSLWKEAFHDTDAFLDTFWQTAFSESRCRCYSIDGEIAGALYWFDCQYENKPVAYLYAIATLEKWQRQGICHRLMEDTHRHLKESGYAGAVLVPAKNNLFDFYESMGYRTCCFCDEFTCRSASEGVSLTPVNKEEFPAYRRAFLPKGSILQENENINLLKTYTSFYRGEDFLLTVEKRNEKPFILELLGNKEVAPKILFCLGAMEGTFRVPGKNKPIAMYFPFNATNFTYPEYFGFAFE